MDGFSAASKSLSAAASSLLVVYAIIFPENLCFFKFNHHVRTKARFMNKTYIFSGSGSEYNDSDEHEYASLELATSSRLRNRNPEPSVRSVTEYATIIQDF